MPPKFDPNSPENAPLIQLFQNLGLASNSATELVRQPKSGKAFKSLIDEYGLADNKYDEKQAGALVKLSSVSAKLDKEQKDFLVQKIVKGDVKTPDQVTGRWPMTHCCERVLCVLRERRKLEIRDNG